MQLYLNTFCQVLCLLLFIYSNRCNAQISISSISPTSGIVGSQVTIIGTGFSSTTTNNKVFFGSVSASVLSATTTQLVAIVPSGGTKYESISVTNITTNLTAYSSKSFNVTFNSCANIASNHYTSSTGFTTGTSPSGIITVDINRDGKADVITANSGSNSISVFRNTSTINSISFSTKVDFTTGTIPIDVATGDIDGDGKMDIVVVNRNSNTVSVFRNTETTGAVSFANKVDFTTGSQPVALQVADFNLDGKPDIVVVNNASNTISLFRNQSISGTILFATKVDYATSNSPNSVHCGVLDDDTKPDIVVGSNTTNVVVAHRNTSPSSSITFASGINISTGNSPVCVKLFDIDSDGKKDIITANESDNTVSVIRNLSSGTTLSFASPHILSFGLPLRSLTVGDFNGDNKPDICVSYNSNVISIITNLSTTGNVTFSNPAVIPANSSSYIENCDINNDGCPDIILPNVSYNYFTVYKYKKGTQPILTNSTNITLCSNNSGTHTFASNESVSFVWSALNNNSFISGESLLPQTGQYLTDNLINTSNSIQQVVYNVILTSSSDVCASSPYLFTVNVHPVPPPPLSTISDTICSIGYATVSALPPSGNYGIVWFSSTSDLSILSTLLSFTTYYATDAIRYAATKILGTSCHSATRLPATITVKNLAAPIASQNLICTPDSLLVNSNLVSGATSVRWFYNISDTIPFHSGLSYTNFFDTTTNYFLAAYDGYSKCESMNRSPATIIVANLSKPDTAIISSNCLPGNVLVNVEPKPNENNNTIRWYNSPTAGNLLATGLEYTQYVSDEAIVYAATYNEQGGCISVDRLPININVHPISTIDSTELATLGNNGFIEVNVVSGVPPYSYDWDNDGIGDFDDQHFIKDLVPGVYKLKIRDVRNCYRDLEYYIDYGYNLFIPTGLSPNGDGKNDIWKIIGTEQFEDISVSVFNLQGQLIHHQKNNYIPWNASVNGNLTPAGDYYFVIYSVDKRKRFTGLLTISY